MGTELRSIGAFLVLTFLVVGSGCSREIPLEVTSEPLRTDAPSAPEPAGDEPRARLGDKLAEPASKPLVAPRAANAVACGLPVYPGARPKPYGNMSVTTGGRTTTIEGFRTADPVLKVAQFYLDKTSGNGKVVDRSKIVMSRTAMTVPIDLASGGRTFVEVTRSETGTETEIKLTFFSDRSQSLD